VSSCYELREYGSDIYYVPGSDFGATTLFLEGEFVRGPETGTTFRWLNDYQQGACSLSINDQECNSCIIDECADGESGFMIDCSNVQEHLVLETCVTLSGAEALEVLTDPEVGWLDNCVPRNDRSS